MKKKVPYLKERKIKGKTQIQVLLVTSSSLWLWTLLCKKKGERRKASNWGWRRRLKVQHIMPAAAQIAWLVRLLMRFLIRGIYSPDFGNITELIKMIGMEKVGCQ